MHTFTKLLPIKIVYKASALIISDFFSNSTTLMIKYFRETAVKNHSKIKFGGFDNLLLAKDF